VAITLIIVFVALWFSNVRATVRVTAAHEPMIIEASVDVARTPTSGEVPGRVVQGVFEKIQEFPVEARNGTSVDTQATGRVRIVNNYSQAQPLVKVTRLLTDDGRLYRIDETVSVPAGGSVEVGAYADELGSAFEFTGKTRFTIPGLSTSLQSLVYAESITPFTGGSRVVTVLTQADIDAAAKELQNVILEQSKKTLRAEVGDSRMTESAFLAKVVDVHANIEPGEQVDRFLLSMKLDVTGVFYPQADLEALVRSRLSDRVPDGRQIVAYDPAKTSFAVGSVNAQNETATVVLSAEVKTQLGNESPTLAKDLILGLPVSEAEAKLESLEGIESATITVRPAWVRRLPRLKDHITVKVE